MKYFEFWDENHYYILTISIFQPSAQKPTHTVFKPTFQLTLIIHLKNTHSIDINKWNIGPTKVFKIKLVRYTKLSAK